MAEKKKRTPMEQAEEMMTAGEMPVAKAEMEMPTREGIPKPGEGRAVKVRPFSPMPRVGVREGENAAAAATPHPSAAPTPSPLGEGFGVQNMRVITEEDVKRAEEIVKRYREGRTALENRVIENQKWFRERHWEIVGKSKNPGEPEPTSAWLFNAIANKHADFMDNYPSPVVLPREPRDKDSAQTLTSILPVVMEQNEYEQTYDDGCWDMLIAGMDVQGVFWNSEKLNGLGDIEIRPIEVLNLYWEPGIRDLQQSANVFHVEMRSVDDLKEEYPQLRDAANLTGNGGLHVRYANDENLNDDDKALVVDWYYKRKHGSKTVLHYAKFCSGHLLFASENEEMYRESGYYAHGQYPFVVSGLFPIKDQVGGFGYVDIMRSPQIYIDKLDQSLLKNTVLGARPRYWVRNDGMVNEKEYADLNNDFVHFTGSGNPADSIFPIQPPEMNPYAITLRANKIDELKETSGNRDFSQGGTASGITAASAIAALQEAGSKLSRDMIKERYRAYKKVSELCIELIRQFYTMPRTFRITGKQGNMEFTKFSGQQIGMQDVSDNFMTATRLPVFDVQVVAQKSSPFSTVVQNERAKELYAAAFFRPDMADQALACLEMMSFEGIDEVKQRISQNSALTQLQQIVLPMLLQMAGELDQFKGTAYLPQVQMVIQRQMQMGAHPAMNMAQPMGQEPQVNSVGAAMNGARKSTAGEARKQAANNATPR